MDKEKKILDTALKLFVEFGFHGTPTSKIAKDAGIANGTLFHYFATKETLIKELYVSIKNELNQILASQTSPTDSIKEAFRKLYFSTINWALVNQDEFYYIQQVHFSPHLAQIPAEVLHEQSKMHIAFIEKAKASGDVKIMPNDLLYTLVNSQILGIYQYVLTQPIDQQQEIIEQGFEMIWDLIELKNENKSNYYGATGMVGEGVLHEALNRSEVESVLVINRKPCGVIHQKLKEIIHADFYDISPILGQLSGYNACYFCLGVSSVRMKEPEYFKLTHTLTLNFAEKLSSVNPEMTFCYISGSATDSTEQGKSMWARVKGKTENDLMKLPFKAVYNFRPAFMLPTKGLKNTLPYYKYISWLYPLGRNFFPNYFSTLAELGQAMINISIKGYSKQILEVRDIVMMNN